MQAEDLFKKKLKKKRGSSSRFTDEPICPLISVHLYTGQVSQSVGFGISVPEVMRW